MIALAVSRGGRSVSVSRKVMKLCGSIVHALWHGWVLGNPGGYLPPLRFGSVQCA
jgi:hypothetical protein